jgi:hypothetical protein
MKRIILAAAFVAAGIGSACADSSTLQRSVLDELRRSVLGELCRSLVADGAPHITDCEVGAHSVDIGVVASLAAAMAMNREQMCDIISGSIHSGGDPADFAGWVTNFRDPSEVILISCRMDQ